VILAEAGEFDADLLVLGVGRRRRCCESAAVRAAAAEGETS